MPRVPGRGGAPLTPSRPARLPLSGADYFVWALDRQMRRAGLPGNVCRLIVRLEGPLDAGQLAERVARSEVFGALRRVRARRPLPFLSPRWTVDGPPPPAGLRVTEWGGAEGTDPSARLPETGLRPETSPALTLDLLRGEQGVSHLVLTWHHALMDVRGAELLVAQLGDGATEQGAALCGPAPADGRGALAAALALPATLAFARRSLAFITRTCREPFVSLAGPPPPAAPRNRFRVHWFGAEETERIDGHCQRLEAGFRRSLFYLAASVQAVHGLAARRGGSGGAYVVPVPHDLRRRGARGPVLSNQVSFLFFRVEPDRAGDLRDTVSSLTEQMVAQVRDRTTDSFRTAMELFRPAPLPFYLRQLGRPTGGKLATFFFSDAGESCPGLEDLAGARPAAVTHLAPTADPPGLGVVFSRFRGRLCFVVSWVEGGLAEGEIDRLEADLADALLGEGEA